MFVEVVSCPTELYYRRIHATGSGKRFRSLSQQANQIMVLAQQRYAKSHRILANCRGVKDFRRLWNAQDWSWFSRSVLGAWFQPNPEACPRRNHTLQRDCDAPRWPPSHGPSPAAIPPVWLDHRSRRVSATGRGNSSR